MTARRPPLGTTMLTSLALAAMPVRATPGLYLDYGQAFAVGAAQVFEFLEVNVGDDGSDSTLTVLEFWKLVADWGFALGVTSNSGGNGVAISGAGSSIRALEIYVGQSGDNNSLTISEGGLVDLKGQAFIGLNADSTGNRAVVTDHGSGLTAPDISVGHFGGYNTLTVSSGATVSLYARAAWARDWTSDPGLNAAFQSLPGASFSVHGAQAPENIALVSAAAEMALSAAARLSADFTGEFAEDYQSHAGSLRLSYSW